jgi:hypothetical protein
MRPCVGGHVVPSGLLKQLSPALRWLVAVRRVKHRRWAQRPELDLLFSHPSAGNTARSTGVRISALADAVKPAAVVLRLVGVSSAVSPCLSEEDFTY